MTADSPGLAQGGLEGQDRVLFAGQFGDQLAGPKGAFFLVGIEHYGQGTPGRELEVIEQAKAMQDDRDAALGVADAGSIGPGGVAGKGALCHGA